MTTTVRVATIFLLPALALRRTPVLPAMTGRLASETRNRRMRISSLVIVNAPQAGETRDRFNEVEGLSGWKFNDALHGDDVIPSQLGGGGFIGCDALDQAGLDRIAGLDALVPPLATPLAPIIANSVTNHCLLTGDFVWGEGNILLGGAGSDLLEGRGADDILDGDHYLSVRLSVRSSTTGLEIGSTDLMENKAVTGNFGTGTTGMTLQAAVFAGLVDPGNIVAVREILLPTPAYRLPTAPTAQRQSTATRRCTQALRLSTSLPPTRTAALRSTISPLPVAVAVAVVAVVAASATALTHSGTWNSLASVTSPAPSGGLVRLVLSQSSSCLTVVRMQRFYRRR